MSAFLLAFLLFHFYFFTAGGTFLVFKKLQYPASFILTLNHESRAADLTPLLHKSSLSAGGTLCIKRSSASRADRLTFFYRTQTIGAEISERAHAVAVHTDPRISFDERSTMDAGLFIKCHIQPSSLFPQPPQKRVPGGFCSPQAGHTADAGAVSSLAPHS